MVYIAHEKSRDRLNWKIYELYVLHQIDPCLQLIETQLYQCRGQSEFAIYVKGLMERNAGRISESLELFQASTALNPNNICNLKQVARSLYLLGRYEDAIEIYEKAQEINYEDWEIWHNRGLCFEKIKKYEECIESYQSANSVQRHDSTFMRLANVYIEQKDHPMAVETYKEALEFSPESCVILTSLGLLYLKINDYYSAFDTLGSSLTLDPTNPTTILAAGSIIQNNQDCDVALVKYRIAALKTPNSAQLWNNIAMCFYSKNKYIESISAFRRAIYCDPFDWAIVYNLGLVYLITQNYCSAFHLFSAAINLNNRFAKLFMYLGVSLCYLKDFENGCIALDRALLLIDRKKQKMQENGRGNDNNNNNKHDANEMLSDECLIHINYCISLMRRVHDEHIELYGSDDKPFSFDDNKAPKMNSGDPEEDEYYSYVFEQMTIHKNSALQHWTQFEKLWETLDDDSKNNQFCDIGKQRELLQSIFNA